MPVVVSDINNDYSMKVYALLDNGANGTFCSQKLIRALKLQPEKAQISLNMMGTRLENISMERVDIRVQMPRNQGGFLLKGVLGCEHLNISVDNLVTQDELLRWKHLQDIVDKFSLPDVDHADKVHLLIGVDQPDVLAPRDTRCGEPGQPFAILTGLGWTLNGPAASGLMKTASAKFVETDLALQQSVECFWELEHNHQSEKIAFSVTDHQVISIIENQAHKKGNHYILPIPFKENPNN